MQSGKHLTIYLYSENYMMIFNEIYIVKKYSIQSMPKKEHA